MKILLGAGPVGLAQAGVVAVHAVRRTHAALAGAGTQGFEDIGPTIATQSH